MYYEDLFAALDENKIRFLVAGGVAVALHGAVRMTADLDLIVALDDRNVRAFIDLMGRRGYSPRVPVPAQDFADPAKRARWKMEKNMIVFSWVHSQRPEEIVDVFVDDPVQFDDAYPRRASIRLGRIQIPLLSIADLIEMKEKSGRPQDLSDIEALKELQK